MYRPNIQRAIRKLEADANGKTRRGDQISITYGKGKFEILMVDRGGIKEGWTATWFPYSEKSVGLLNDVILGKKLT